MKVILKLFVILAFAVSLIYFPAQRALSECSQEGEPCSGGLGECCPTYTNDKGETRKLKCSTDLKTENTCVDDGTVENIDEEQ